MDLITRGNQDYKPQKNNAFSKLMKSVNRKKSVAEIELSDKEYDELIQCIKLAKSQWEIANLNFEQAQEKELIDYYAYEIKACEIRYEYFLKKAKEKGINVNI